DVEESASPEPPPAGTPPIPAPPPAQIKQEHKLSVMLDGSKFKIRNLGPEPLVIRQLVRQGFEPVNFGSVLPAGGILDLHVRDARGGTLVIERIGCMDVVAPRKFAIVRHAGQLLPRPTLVDEFSIPQLPLVPKRQNNHTKTE
ncbi:MAG TPA: hypothetical protein VG722_10890, partial [Tepidisphaeraceae bacterium]|nr:hypothetical protein [Tepidisphaeraceae bacterium]